MADLQGILGELDAVADQVKDDEITRLAELILAADQIFVTGAGRSGFMVKAFAMRLMHLGLKSYVVGEVITPGITDRDLLVIGSGSGGTMSLVGFARKAKESYGAKVALVTIKPESPIGEIADTTVVIPAPTPKAAVKAKVQSIQPMGSLFEQSLLLVLDATILKLMERMDLNSPTMFTRHANLE